VPLRLVVLSVTPMQLSLPDSASVCLGTSTPNLNKNACSAEILAFNAKIEMITARNVLPMRISCKGRASARIISPSTQQLGSANRAHRIVFDAQPKIKISAQPVHPMLSSLALSVNVPLISIKLHQALSCSAHLVTSLARVVQVVIAPILAQIAILTSHLQEFLQIPQQTMLKLALAIAWRVTSLI